MAVERVASYFFDILSQILSIWVSWRSWLFANQEILSKPLHINHGACPALVTGSKQLWKGGKYQPSGLSLSVALASARKVKKRESES